MNKIIKPLKMITIVIATLCLSIATALFLYYNAPIIKQDILLGITSLIILVGMLISIFIKGKIENKWIGIANAIASVVLVAFVVNSLLFSVVIDFFQPLSLYDVVIYLALTGLILFVILIVAQAVISLKTKTMHKQFVVLLVLTSTFILQFFALSNFQTDFEYENITGDSQNIFVAGEGGYEIFRIPTLLVIPKGATLADSTVLEEDQIHVMAEARRNGSLDHGDIDLVQKISKDGGKTWSELMVIREYEEGIGKIGNSTPMYDVKTGSINLLHLAGNQDVGYSTYHIQSADGGNTWSVPTFVYEGAVGPGHGIMIEGGAYDGRLVAPGYHEGGSRAIYSDDNGTTWTVGEKVSDGNEAEIAQVDDEGNLVMMVRTDIGVAKLHGKLQKIYTRSSDGGATWSELVTLPEIKEPICMASIVNVDNRLYYSYPNDYYSRGEMTIALSEDGGNSYPENRLIYQGPAGYSQLASNSEGNLLLAFETGAIEYDERITLVEVPTFH